MGKNEVVRNEVERGPQEEIDLVDLIKILYKGKNILAVFLVLGLLLGAVGGVIKDKKIVKDYQTTLEFVYNPQKAKNIEEFRLYSANMYKINSLIRKEGVSSQIVKYDVPTIMVGDNAVRFNKGDSYNYKIYMDGTDREKTQIEVKKSYEKFLSTVYNFGFEEDEFYKLSEVTIESSEKKKFSMFIAMGLIIGIILGVFMVFLKEFYIFMKKDIKK